MLIRLYPERRPYYQPAADYPIVGVAKGADVRIHDSKYMDITLRYCLGMVAEHYQGLMGHLRPCYRADIISILP